MTQFPPKGFRPLTEAILDYVTEGTVADLHMHSGRIYRAIWTQRGTCTAWWPFVGQRKRPIGLMDPVAIRIHARYVAPDTDPA